MRNKKDSLTKEYLENLYVENKLSIREVGKIIGLSYEPTRNILLKHGIVLRKPPETRIKSKNYFKLTDEEIKNLYENKKFSSGDIAKLYQVSPQTIIRRMKKANIPIKENKESARNFHDKNTKVNLDFFFTMSSELAYFLGLMVSDGNVSNTYQIRIGMNDKDVIEWVAKTIGYNSVISVDERTNSKGKVNHYYIYFKNARIFELLNQYEIKPNKSLTVKFPNIPEEYIVDFIRGVFDGDGTISSFYTKKGNYSTYFAINSASEQFIKQIKIEIENAIGGNRKITKTEIQKNPYYCYSVGGIYNIEKIYSWLYNEEKFGMKRKKEKFENAIKEFNESKRGVTIQSVATFEKLYDWYIVKDFTQKEIAKYFNCTPGYVSDLLKIYKISKNKKRNLY